MHRIAQTLGVTAAVWFAAGAIAEARFLQSDPVGYQVDMNLYTYVMNDPLNRTDPSGLLSCSASDAGGQAKCDIVVQDAERASAQLRGAQGRLNNLSGALSSGGRLNREQRQTQRAFESVYGRGSATAENVSQVAEAAGAAADWLDSPDTQAVLAGPSRDAYASVPAPGANTVNIYDSYFGSGGRERGAQARAGSLIHEGGHGGANMPRHYSFGIPAPGGGYSRYFYCAYGAAGITAYRDIYGTGATLNEADALRCAVQPMSSTCP